MTHQVKGPRVRRPEEPGTVRCVVEQQAKPLRAHHSQEAGTAPADGAWAAHSKPYMAVRMLEQALLDLKEGSCYTREQRYVHCISVLVELGVGSIH